MNNIKIYFKWGKELWPGTLLPRVGEPENTDVQGNAYWVPKSQKLFDIAN